MWVINRSKLLTVVYRAFHVKSHTDRDVFGETEFDFNFFKGRNPRVFFNKK